MTEIRSSEAPPAAQPVAHLDGLAIDSDRGQRRAEEVADPKESEASNNNRREDRLAEAADAWLNNDQEEQSKEKQNSR